MATPNGPTSADHEILPEAPSAPGSSPAVHTIYTFSASAGVAECIDFRLDPMNRLLTSAGREVALPGRAFDALEVLVSRPGELVTKEELMVHIWAGSFVEESNLTVAISTLRRALNEDPQDRRYIQTVARRGYRFIAEVRESHELPRTRQASTLTPLPLEPQTATLSPESGSTTDSDPPPRPAESHAAGSTLRLKTARFSLLAYLVVPLLLALGAACWFLLKPREKIQTLAVVPFALDGAGANGSMLPSEIVLLGMTDGLVQQLEGQLVVRPTSSMLRYSEGGAVDPLAAGREQAVDAVLTGMLENRAGHATLRLRLLRIRDHLTLWQDSFSGDWSNLPQIVHAAGDSAARELRRQGAALPHAASAATVAAPLTNGAAYQLYLRGRYFWNRRTVDGLRKSVDYFRQSIAADPNYAPAYAGLADSYALLASFSVEPGAAANVDARSAAFSAIHLDPTLAEPHASLGMIYFFTDWNPQAAEGEFERAIQLNPNYATAHHWYALDLAAMGRFPQALYEIRLAQKLDPLSLIIGTNVGWIEYLARNYAAATHDLGRVLELDPTFARARTRLGMVELAQGEPTAAAADFARALTPAGDPPAETTAADPFVEGLLGDAEARSGNTTAAEKTLTALRSRNASQYVPPISRGLVLLGLNRRSEALAEFAKSVDDHSTSMVYARVDPALDDLRPDPAFQALLARMKF